jgi:cold shock CspA family protein
MDRPLEIAFHGVDPSPSLEADIRQHVAKLDQRFPRLVGCRVSIEGLHNQHRTGNVYEVHIVLSVPGKDLAVSREPHKAKERYANPDVRTALRDAFKAAERQLQEHKWEIRSDTQAPSGHALLGRVSQLFPDRDYGFIRTPTSATELYFHRDAVTNAEFTLLKLGDHVQYVEEMDDDGPVAKKVRRSAGPPG